MYSHLLLADMDDILKVVATIVFVVLSGLGQLMASRDKGKKARPKARDVGGGNRPAPGAGPAGPKQDALRREVDDFLRKARGEGAGRRPAQQSRPAASRPSAAPPVESSQRRRPPLSSPLSDTSQGRTPAQRPAAQHGAPQRAHESVAQHVQSHLGSHPITEHSSHLAEDIGQADERMEAHLRERFSHKLGSLAHEEEAVIQLVDDGSIAADLVRTLTQPRGVQQLILANEILRRPEDRWVRGSG